jgi:glyoxylase-like metal-dependent hydrolase (beta-lactamase superfamily II)
MKQIADGLWQLRGFPPNVINIYLAEDVLIDAGTKYAGRRILSELKGRAVTAHALTHAHADHQGASHEVCEKLDIPLWCGEGDADRMEQGTIMEAQPKHWLNRVIGTAWAGPAHPVARRLREGDEVAGFTVLEVPGHSAGHVAYWRERDRVLIAGDVFNTMNLLTTIPGLREPPAIFTPDPARNRESQRRLAELEPALLCAGHGPPWRDPAAITAFVEKLARAS